MSKCTMVKLLAMFTAVLLFVAGCTTSAVVTQKPEPATQAPTTAATEQPPTEEPLPPVKLLWYMIGSGNQPDEGIVLEAANKYAKEKINADVTFTIFDWNDYDQKMQLKIASSEEFDICFTSDWACNYYQNASKGAFLDIGELVPKYAPKKYAAIPGWVWEGLKVDGHLYGVINGFIAWQDEFIFRKDLVEKFNFDYMSVKNLKDVEPFLEMVKKDDPTMVPYAMTGKGQQSQNFMYSLANIDQLVGVGFPGVIRRDDDSLTVINQYEWPAYTDMLKTLHEWYVKGYINQDAATAADNQALVKAHKTAASHNGAYYEGGEKESEPQWDNMALVAVPLLTPHVPPDSIVKTINAVSITSKNPERSVMLLELSNTDRAFFRILGAGIEGVHYTDIGDNFIRLNEDSKYLPWNNWAWGDLDRNGYLTEGQPATMLDAKANSGVTANPSKALGFAFKTEPVKTEFAQIQTVVDKYYSLLLTGTADVDVVLPEFNAALRGAGLDKLFAELQKQLHEWNAAKK